MNNFTQNPKAVKQFYKRIFLISAIFTLIFGYQANSQTHIESGDTWLNWSIATYSPSISTSTSSSLAGWNNYTAMSQLPSTSGKYYLDLTSSATGNKYFRLANGAGSNRYGPSGTSDVQLSTNASSTLTDWNSGAGKAYFISVSNTNYHYIIKSNGATSKQVVIWEVQGALSYVTALAKSVVTPTQNDVVPITATLNSSLPIGQAVYLRYTTNGFSTSTVVQMTGSSTSYSANIPAQTAGTTVQYYVFTSGSTGVTPASDGSNADWYAFNYWASQSNGGTNPSYVVQSAPTITLGTNPQVCQGTTSAGLTYSATTNSPNQYSITFDSTALSAGFVNVSNATLPSSPITITVPSGVATNTYNATLTVKNTTTGAVSSNYPITITVVSALSAGTLSGTQAICSNGTTTFSSTVGGGTWSSGSTGVATINSSGVITPVSAGTSTITYSVSGSGCTTATATRTVTVTTAPNAGTLSGIQNICLNGTTTFTSNGDSGGTWSSDSPSTIASINSSTGIITPIASGTATMTYTVTGIGGCSNATASRTVTISALSVGGSITPSSTSVCAGTNSTALTLSGNTGSVTKWQYSTVSDFSSGVVDISNTTATQTATNLSVNTYYRAVIANGVCPAVNSSTAAITTTSSVGGTATAGSSSVCLSGSTTISLSGQTGSTIQWQSSDNAGTTWTSISGATSPTYTTPSLYKAMSYRASVTNGSCSSALSSSVTISINGNTSVGSSTWTNSQNDNTVGFGAWSLSSGGGGGFFAASSSNTTIDILNGNTNGWGLYANGSTPGTNFANATRPVTMNIGNVLSFSMDNGQITSGSKVGFNLMNASGQNLMEFSFTGGDSFYKIIDSATQTTSIGYTTSGLDVSIVYTAINTYSIYITPRGSSTNTSYTSRNFSAQTTQIPTQIKLFNNGAGSGGVYDLFFNSLNISNPVILVSPSTVGQSICSTTTASALSVTASGTGLSYQWYQNNTASTNGSSSIPGATSSSYTPASVVGTNYYYCVVTGSCGSTISGFSGAITVTAAPNAGILSGIQSVCSNSSTTFSSTQSGGSWSSSDTSIATINTSTGVITPISAGTATMTYTVIDAGGRCSNATATRDVTVIAAPSLGTLSGNQNICLNGSTTFSSTISGGTWSSGNTSIATIGSTSGVITPVTTGTAVMTYSYTLNGCTSVATRTVTVISNLNAGTISGTQTVCSNGSTIFSSNGNTGGVWSSSTASVAIVNALTGAITPVDAGTAIITYTVSGAGCLDATATRDVSVIAQPSVSAGTIISTCGSSGSVNITAGATATNSTSVTWTSSGSGTFTNANSLTLATYTPSAADITAGSVTLTLTATGNSPCGNVTSTKTLTISKTTTWNGSVNNDWNNASNWSCGVPTSVMSVVIPDTTITNNNAPILNTGSDGNVSSITINTNGSFTMGGTKKLTIASGGSFVNNGTFNADNGTIEFSLNGSISGTSIFNNVILNGGVNFGAASTIGSGGSLQINTGGYVNTNAPSYAASSTLVYNSGTSYARSIEWSTTSGKGYPGNVTIQNGTTVTWGNPGSDIGIAGNLSLGATGSAGSLTLQNGNKLIIAGNVLIGSNSGTSNLTLSTNSGGDIKVGGNWSRSANGTFTPNGRAVYFTGSGTNIVNSNGGASFDYLVSEKTGGSIQLGSNMTVNAPNGGNTLSLKSAASFDLNGNTLNLSYANSTNVQADGGVVNFTGSTGSTINITSGTKTFTQINGGSFVFGSNVSITTSTGIDFGSNLSTVNGVLQINSNGFLIGNAPTYGNTSTLIYNSGGTYNRNIEWGTTSGPGYPNHVTIQNSTSLNVINGSNSYKKAAGNLTVASGSTLSIANLTSGSSGVGIEFLGNIINDGTITLSGTTNQRLKGTNLINGNSNATASINLASNVGGDLELTGNYQDNANFTANGRAVFFTGNGTQIISGTAAAPFNIDYIVSSKSSGSIQLGVDCLTGAPNGGNAITLSSATDVFDLNGKTFTLGMNGVASTISGSGVFKGSASSNMIINGTGAFGTVRFDQTTLGTTNVLNNLTINRTSTGGIALGNDLNVLGTTTLTAGTITLGTNNLTIGSSGTISVSSPDATKMIIANGSGQLRKIFGSNGSFTYPIGDSSSNYSPATLNFTAGSYGTAAYAGINITKAKHSNNTSSTDYINRYWTISTNGISSPTCSTSFTYVSGDVVGTESNLFGGSYLSSTWNCLGAVNSSSHTISGTVSSFGDITAGEAAIMGCCSNPTSGGTIANTSFSICSGTAPEAFTSSTSASGQSGTLEYKWQASTTSSTSGFSDISSATGATYTPGTLTTTTWFKRLSKVTCSGSWTTAGESNVIQIAVNENLSASVSIDATATTICSGTSVTFTATPTNGGTNPSYQWQINGANVGVDSSTYTTSSIADSDVISVIMTSNASPCLSNSTVTSNTITMTVESSPNSGTITGSSELCIGNDTTFVSNGNSGGSWASSDNSIASVTASGVITGIHSGSVVITYTVDGNEVCSSAQSSKNITINELPSVSITNNSEVTNLTCSQNTIYIAANSSNSISWSNGLTIVGTNADLSIEEAGQYIVTATNSYGCSSSASITITDDRTYYEFYLDNDNDGFGTGSSVSLCAIDSLIAPSGYSVNNSDCDDSNASIHSPITYYVDADGDGNGSTTSASFCSLTAPNGYSDNNTDCNDENASIQEEITYYIDNDQDGFGSNRTENLCSMFAPSGYATNHDDCDDMNEFIQGPVTYYQDSDSDGYSIGTADFCDITPPRGYASTTNGSDCDDSDATVHSLITYYVDADGDGFGSTVSAAFCASIAPEGYSSNNSDCNDSDASVNASASISTQPENAAICKEVGGTASFTVVATPGSTFQWYTQVANTTTSPWTLVTNNTTYYGYNSPTLNITRTSSTFPANGTKYKVVVTNSCGTVTSNIVTLADILVSKATAVAAVTKLSPALTTCENTSVMLQIAAGSIGNVQWQMSTTSATDGFVNVGTVYTQANLSALNPIVQFQTPSLTQDSWFRVVVSNGVCSSATSAALKITVSTTPVAGSISGGNVSVCAPVSIPATVFDVNGNELTSAISNSTTLELTGNTIGTTLLWQKSLNYGNTSGAPVTWSAAGSTNSTLIVSALSSDTWYRVQVTNGACITYTDVVKITVIKVARAGSITCPNSVCTGGNITFTSGAYVGNNISWEISTTSSTTGFTAVSGAHGLTFTMNNVNLVAPRQRFWIRNVVVGDCTLSRSVVRTITVNPLSVAGTVSGAGTVCTGGGTTLKLTGNVGTIQWQYSTDGNTYTNVPSSTVGSAPTFTTTSANGTSAMYIVANVTDSTYFRAVVTSGACSSSTTTPVQMIVGTQAIAGTVTADATTLCPATGTNLTLTGNVGAIQWQKASVVGGVVGTFASITGKTTSVLATGNLSATTAFRAAVTIGDCSTVYTDTTVITVNLAAKATAISGNTAVKTLATAICSTSTVPLTLASGYVGTNLQWQYYNAGSDATAVTATTANALTWTDITGATATVFNAGVGQSGNIWYRVKVSSGSCSVAYSAPVNVWYKSCAARVETAPVSFKVEVYPNPSSEVFNFTMTTPSESNVMMMVYDMTGKLIDQREVAPSEVSELQLGERYPSGVYNVIVTQGENTKTLRVIKR